MTKLIDRHSELGTPENVSRKAAPTARATA